MTTTMPTVDELVAAAATLSDDDLLDLCDAVDDSLAHVPHAFTAAEIAEYQRISDAVERGDERLIPGEQVAEEMRNWRAWVR